MATTSPYSQNDYQSFQYRPYELPVNDIMKAFVAKTQYWEMGAAKVRSAYENAAGLDLTGDDNKQVRDQYLQQAQSKIQNLSSQDLADPEVQKAGMSIFTPLFQDQAIMYDDAITKKMRGVQQDAQSYKTKKLSPDGTIGEGYNADNVGFAMRPFQGFDSKIGRDVDKLKSIYGSVANAEYTPYTDVKKEYMKLKDQCTPDEMSHTSVNGMYFNTVTEKGVTEAQLSGCIGAGLSDAATRQLQITGTMRMGQDVPYLGKAYTSILDNDNKQYASTILGITAAVAKMKKEGTLTPEIQSSADAQLSTAKQEMIKNTDIHNKINQGDYSYITSNLEHIAGRVYHNESVNSFAKGFQYMSTDEKQTANPAGMLVYKTQNENKLGMMEMMNSNAQEDKKNDLEIFKTLYNKGDVGSAILTPILKRLGINMEDLNNNSEYLNPNPSVQDLTNGIDKINQDADNWRNELQKGNEGVVNEVKNIAGVAPGITAAIDKVAKNPDGTYDADKLENFIATHPNLKEVQTLSTLLSNLQYTKLSAAKAVQQKNDLDKQMQNNPAAKNLFEDHAKNIASIIGSTMNEETADWRTSPAIHAVSLFDNSAKRQIVIPAERLAQIAKGNDADYELKEHDGGGAIFKKANGEMLSTGTGFFNSFGFTPIDKRYVLPDTAEKIFMKLVDEKNNYIKDMTPHLSENLGKVAVTRREINVGGDAMIHYDANRELKGILPAKYQGKDYVVTPTGAYDGGDGLGRVRLKVNKVVTDPDDKRLNSIGEDVTSDAIKDLNSSNFSMGGTHGPITMENGELVMKRQMPQFGINPLRDAMTPMVEHVEQQPLANRQHIEVLGPTSYGVQLGLDVIGSGGDEKTYQTWIRPLGKQKIYMNTQDITDRTQALNDLNVKLQAIQGSKGALVRPEQLKGK